MAAAVDEDVRAAVAAASLHAGAYAREAA